MKKNKIYVNKIDKKINNNQKSFNINEEINEVSIRKDDSFFDNEISVQEKLDKLLNRNGYIFNVNVKIITDNREYKTKIAGKVNNNLITLDHDIININEIKDIIVI